MPPPESLLFLNFNQDQGCFACGTDNGFRIYNVEPFKETFRRRFDLDEANRDEGAANSENTVVQGTGIGIVEMLFRCNILALVGGGHTPRFSPNKVMLWDDHQSRPIGELSFRVEVRAVKLRRDKIVVVLEHKIYVYNFRYVMRFVKSTFYTLGVCCLRPVSMESQASVHGVLRHSGGPETSPTPKSKRLFAHTLLTLFFFFTQRFENSAPTRHVRQSGRAVRFVPDARLHRDGVPWFEQRPGSS